MTPELEDRIVDKVDWEFKKIEDEKLLKALSEDPVYEYNKTKPVIGLDYLLKMKHRGKFRRFCVLCETFLPHDTYSHVVDIKHQATYIVRPIWFFKASHVLRHFSLYFTDQTFPQVVRKGSCWSHYDQQSAEGELFA